MTKEAQHRYPGSRPFTEYDKNLFFGRDEDIDELRKFVNVEKLVVLYARSGLGKSSAINAGLMPIIEKENIHIPINYRFKNYQSHSADTTPLDLFKQITKDFFENYQKENTSLFEKDFFSKINNENISLWQYFKTLHYVQEDRKRILLIFDQFEELFTYPDEKVHEFAEALADLISNVIPRTFKRAFTKKLYLEPELLDEEELNVIDDPIEIKILLSIRSDKLNLLNRLNVEIPNILRNCYELHPLNKEQATTAIIRPGRKKGNFISPPFYYSPEALDIILNYLTQEGKKNDDIEPFQLQILCQHVEENIVIAEDDDFIEPEDLGDLKNIYQSYYDYQISRLPSEEEQNSARLLIEEGLIFEEEERRITLYEGQIYSKYGVDKKLLDKLVDAHLLRSEPSSQGGYNYELTHDSLVAPILKAKEYRTAMEKFEEDKLVAQQKYQEANEQKLKLWNRVLRVGGVAIFVIVALLISLLMINQARSALQGQIESSELATIALRVAKFNPTNALWITQKGLSIVENNPALLLVRAENLSENSFYQNKIQVYDFNLNTVAISPNSKYIATGGGGRGELVLLDMQGKELWRKTHSPKLRNINSLAFSQDSEYLVTGGADGLAVLWDLKGNQLKTFKGHKEEIKDVVFSPDGKKLLTTGEDNIAYIWNVATATIEVTLKNRNLDLSRVITCGNFSPDGNLIALGASDGKVEIWSRNGAKLYSFKAHKYDITSVVFSPAGRYLLTASKDKTFALTDLKSGNPEATENMRIVKSHAPINEAIFSKDGHYILLAGENNQATLWNADEGSLMYEYKGAEAPVKCIDFSPENDFFLTGDGNGKLLIWAKEAMKKEVFRRSGRVKAAVFDPSNPEIIFIASEDGRLSKCNIDGKTIKNYIENSDNVKTLSISKDAKFLATGDSKGVVRLWNMSTENSKVIAELEQPIHKIIAHPSKNQWLICLPKKTILISSEGKEMKDLGYKSVQDAKFANNGEQEHLFLAHREGVDILDIENFDKIRTLGDNQRTVNVIDVSSDSKTVVMGFEDSYAEAWSFDGNKICTFIGHTEAIYAIDISEDNQYIATGGTDELIKIWDMSGREIETLRGYSGAINTLEFSKGGEFLLAACEKNNATLWYLLESFLQSPNIYKPSKEELEKVLKEAEK